MPTKMPIITKHSLIFSSIARKTNKTMKITFNEIETTSFIDNQVDLDPEDKVANLIEHENFDNEVSYGDAGQVYDLVSNKEFAPGVGILNVSDVGMPSLLINMKIHQTSTKHSYFALQVNLNSTSKIVKIANENKPTDVTIELLKHEKFLQLNTHEEIMNMLFAKKAEDDTLLDTKVSSSIAIPAEWCLLFTESKTSQELAVNLLHLTVESTKDRPQLNNNDWIKRVINFAQLLFVMPDKAIAFESMGLTIEDIDTTKKNIYGSKVIREILNDFEGNSKPEAANEEDDASSRIPICTECNSSSHLSGDCPNLVVNDNPREDVESRHSITDDLLGLRIPKKVKTGKEAEPIEIMEDDDDDEESNASIVLPEANFTSIRDKYQKKVALGSANESTQMALMLASIMKTDKNVLSKTSAYGIQSLEAITVDFNGNGGNKMSRHPHRILFETSDKDDIPKFFNTELRRSLGEDDDPIGTIDKNTTRLIMKGNLIGDSTIRDPKEAEGVSIFAMVPDGETSSSKTTSSQSIFIPSTSEQFLEMLRSFKILLRFIAGKNSAAAIQSKRLHINFKKVKLSLRDFFAIHKEDGGKYLCLIIYNLTFNMLSDIVAGKEPSTDHLQMDSLINQLQIGMTIPVPTTNPPANHAGGKKNNESSGRKRSFNNQIPNSPRSIGEYVFEEGKEYGKFFGGCIIGTHQPSIPKVKGKSICVAYLINGKCNNNHCKNYHGSATSAKEQISKWISGNSLPLKIRE